MASDGAVQFVIDPNGVERGHCACCGARFKRFKSDGTEINHTCRSSDIPGDDQVAVPDGSIISLATYNQ